MTLRADLDCHSIELEFFWRDPLGNRCGPFVPLRISSLKPLDKEQVVAVLTKALPRAVEEFFRILALMVEGNDQPA